ncbi:MAG: choice-of-anchor D domain-containing protein [Archangium sp.]
MKREARLLVGLMAVLAACVPELEGAPCVVDEHCPAGQRCGGDGRCSLSAMGGGDGATGGGGMIVSGLDAGLGGGAGGGGGGGADQGGGSGGGTQPGSGLRAERTQFDFGNVMVNGSAMATVSFINDSEEPTDAMSVGVGGVDAAGFSIVNDGCGGALGAQGRCSVELRFFPERPGSFSASLDVVASPGGTVSMAITGNGLAPAQLVLSPSSHDYGAAVQGVAAAPQTFKVRNSGGVNSGMVTIAATGSSASELIIVNNACIVPLIPNGECEFTGIFIPGSPGAKTATLTASGTPGGMAVASITGQGLSTPSLEASPASVTFSGTVVHAHSDEVTITVTNEGTGPTAAFPATVTPGGMHPTDFEITDNGCVGPLAGNSSCLVKVRFAPTFTGARAGSLTLGPTGTTVTIPLSGIGLTAAALSIAPLSHALGNVTTGAVVTTPFIVTNTGESQASGIAPSVSGTHFALHSSGCPSVLAGGAQCTVVVRFSAPATPPSSQSAGTLTVNATGLTAATAGITADVVVPGALSMTPASFTFTPTLQGSTRSTTFTVTNTGGSGLAQPSFALSGMAPSQYAIGTTTCTGALAPAASCTVDVSFSPVAPARQIQNAILEVSSGTFRTSSSLAGEALKAATLSVTPTSLAFGTVTSGQTSPAQDVTVTNTGDIETGTITASMVDAAFVLGSPTNDCRNRTLTQGQSCVLRITFSPTSSGPKNEMLNISATPGGSTSVTLTGTGRSPASLSLAAAAGSSTAFGGVLIPGTKEQTFTLTNSGETASSNLTMQLTGDGFSIAMGGMNACTAGTPLAAGTSCSVRVVFTASAPGGPATGVLSVSATAGGMASLNLTATAQRAALLTSVEATHGFSLVAVGGTSPSYTWTITNAGEVPSGVIDPVTVSAPFTRAMDTCSGATLAPGASCSMQLTFAPTASGPATANLELTANPGGSAAMALSGTGGWTLTMTGPMVANTSLSTTDGKITNCSAGATCTALYNEGDTPTLRGHTSNGPMTMRFLAWDAPVECTNYGRGSWCTLTMNGHKSASATFSAPSGNLAFVTSTTVRANVGLSGFDALCNATATDAGINNAMGEQYIAFVSDSDNSLDKRWKPMGGLERLDGRTFARSRAELFAHEIRHPLHLDEFGRRIAAADDAVWTGATWEAKRGRNCDDWSRSDSDGGVADFADRGSLNGGPVVWVNRSGDYSCASATARVMCFQNRMNAMPLPASAVPATGKRMFRTAGVPMPANAAAADAICQSNASDAQLTGTYKALIATMSQAPSAVLSDATTYYRVDGSRIATGASLKLMPAVLSSGIWHDASGALVDDPMNESHAVWTGSANVNAIGTVASTCDGWTSLTGTSTAGVGVIANAGYFNGFGLLSCGGVRSLYCVEQ